MNKRKRATHEIHSTVKLRRHEKTTIFDLPVEILEYIVKFSGVGAYEMLANTCRTFHPLVKRVMKETLNNSLDFLRYPSVIDAQHWTPQLFDWIWDRFALIANYRIYEEVLSGGNRETAKHIWPYRDLIEGQKTLGSITNRYSFPQWCLRFASNHSVAMYEWTKTELIEKNAIEDGEPVDILSGKDNDHKRHTIYGNLCKHIIREMLPALKTANDMDVPDIIHASALYKYKDGLFVKNVFIQLMTEKDISPKRIVDITQAIAPHTHNEGDLAYCMKWAFEHAHLALVKYLDEMYNCTPIARTFLDTAVDFSQVLATNDVDFIEEIIKYSRIFIDVHGHPMSYGITHLAYEHKMNALRWLYGKYPRRSEDAVRGVLRSCWKKKAKYEDAVEILKWLCEHGHVFSTELFMQFNWNLCIAKVFYAMGLSLPPLLGEKFRCSDKTIKWLVETKGIRTVSPMTAENFSVATWKWMYEKDVRFIKDVGYSLVDLLAQSYDEDIPTFPKIKALCDIFGDNTLLKGARINFWCCIEPDDVKWMMSHGAKVVLFDWLKAIEGLNMQFRSNKKYLKIIDWFGEEVKKGCSGWKFYCCE